MPIILTDNVEFGKVSTFYSQEEPGIKISLPAETEIYYLSLREVVNVAPQIKKGGKITFI